MRRKTSGLIRVREALFWGALGFVLHWAVSWQPVASGTTSVPPSQPARMDHTALRGRRIVLASSLPRAQGVPDTGPDAWLRALLSSAGAQVGSAMSGDPALSGQAELVIQLVPGTSPAWATGQARFSYPSGDSVSARACLFLSAGLAGEMGLPFVPPVPGPSAVANGTPVVRIEMPRSQDSPQLFRTQAAAMTRALARYFAARPAASDSTG